MTAVGIRVEQVTSAVTLTTTTEAVAVTSDIVPLSPIGGEGYIIKGVVNVTTGTAATAVTIRVRQGTGITGTVVGNALTHTLAAGATASIPFSVQDFSAALTPPTAQYSVTVQQVAATANGTVNQGTIEVCNTAPWTS